jgi:hypothetical protein
LKFPRLDITQIEQAFQGGYDPALELAVQGRHSLENQHTVGATEDVDVMHDPLAVHLRRKEQDTIDRIIHGDEGGHYFLIFGCKVSLSIFFSAFLIDFYFIQGTGKTTMILDAMQANQAEGVSMCDAHPDLEVFRLRLGKALNYEFNEDSQTGLFSRRDPREGENTPLRRPS